MNFLEFLKEDVNKDLYVIINTRDGDIPKEGPTEPFKTWAVSPAKAKWQIIHRLKQSPDKYSWKVLNNPDDYEAITWEQYQEIEDKRIVNSPSPEGAPRAPEPKQLTLFNDPQLTTPY